MKGLESILKLGRKLAKAAAVIALPFILNSNADASSGSIVLANHIDSPYTNSTFSVVHRPENLGLASEGLDDHDSKDAPMYNPSGVTSRIYSTVEGEELDIDQRPEFSTSDVSFDLGLAFESGSGQISSSNYLNISCSGFEGEDVTITIDGNSYDAKTTSTIDLDDLVNQSGGSYGGGTVSFSSTAPTITLGEIDTLDPENVTDTSATFYFDVESDGYEEGDESWEAGFGYRPSTSSTWTWTNEIQGQGEGTHQKTVTELNPNTQYNVISYITNSAGTAYGDVEYFTTSEAPVVITDPDVDTLEAIVISPYEVQVRARLNDDGDPESSDPIDAGFAYWLTGQEQTYQTELQKVTEGQTFTSSLSVDPNNMYDYFGFAVKDELSGQGATRRFSTPAIEPNEPEPIDPNASPIALDPNSQTLVIQNNIKQFGDVNEPHANKGNFVYTEKSGNSHLFDANDVFYLQQFDPEAKVVSLIGIENGEVMDFYELSTHATDPNDPNSQGALLEFSLATSNDPTINSENSMRFWVSDPNNLEGMFDSNPINLQEIDASDPNTTHPLHDVKKYISQGKELKLQNIATSNVDPNELQDPNNTKIIEPNLGYSFWDLSTKKKFGDFDDANGVELKDYEILTADLGKTGIYITDLAGREDPNLAPQIGQPDKKIDANDAIAFARTWTASNGGIFPANPGIIEDFEGDYSNGGFQPYWNNGSNGTVPWVIDSNNSTSGKFSAKAGKIGDNETSALEFSVNLDRPGILKFNRKVYSGSGEDWANMYINGTKIKRWSGNKNWQEEIFNLSSGTYDIKFTFEKSPVDSLVGEEFRIDDVQVIPNEYIGAKLTPKIGGESILEKRYLKDFQKDAAKKFYGIKEEA